MRIWREKKRDILKRKRDSRVVGMNVDKEGAREMITELQLTVV